MGREPPGRNEDRRNADYAHAMDLVYAAARKGDALFEEKPLLEKSYRRGKRCMINNL